MTDPLFLVTNASGKTGAAVVRQLRRLGLPVRAQVRRSTEQSRALAEIGAEVVIADPLDPQQMRDAMAGARRAYHLPPFHPSMLPAAEIFAATARAVGLEAVVVLSQWLASPDHPAWLTRQLWDVEHLFGALPAHLTIVAPPFFADNYLRLIGFAAHLGVLPSLTADSRNAPPSNEDIAAVIVEALLDPQRHAGQRYCPTGPELLSTADMAAILSSVLGRRVRRVELPMWLFLKAARLQRVPAEELSGFRYWVQDHRDGAFAWHLPTADVERLTGRPPEDFATIAARYARLPEAERSFRSDLAALLNFLRTPFSPGYDLDRFDRIHGLTASDHARFAMENPVWQAERATRAAHLVLA